MNALALKIIAMILMLIDHIGFIYGNVFLRAVGRLAFPIFAFLIANGFRHTRSMPKYALRLLAFAVISEIPFDLFTANKVTVAGWHGLFPELKLDNVFFTLFLGLCFLWLNDIYKKRGLKFAKLLSVVTFVFLAALAGFISSDYGAVGVAWVAMFGIFDSNDKNNLLPLAQGSVILASWHVITNNFAMAIFELTAINIGSIPGVSYFINGGKITTMNQLQIFAAFAIFFILCYNGKSGLPKDKNAKAALKYAFYAFYPLHLLVLYYILYNVIL